MKSLVRENRQLKQELARLKDEKTYYFCAAKAAEQREANAVAERDCYQEKYLKEQSCRREAERRLKEEMQRNFDLTRQVEDLASKHHDFNELLEKNRQMQNQIADLLRAKAKLEKKLNIRKGTEDPYGMSTPSSRKVAKANSTEENQKKVGGAVPGHIGHGRHQFTKEQADEIRQNTALPQTASSCCEMPDYEAVGVKTNSYVDFVPAKMKIIYETNTVFRCRACGKQLVASSPDALPKSKYSNTAVSILLNEAFGNLMPYGVIAARYNINKGTLIEIYHRMAYILEPVFQYILDNIKKNKIVFGDETGWSVDGKRAYVWLFATTFSRLYLFRDTRASSVPQEVFAGLILLNLILSSDRYCGYNNLPVLHQYCYVHLLRDLKKLEVEFPDEPEVKCFVDDFKVLLQEAIGLRGKGLSIESYRQTAADLKKKIMDRCNASANHPAIQAYQDIFRNGEDRLFQWIKSPDIPCDNNFAERNLRPVVIARKMSFGCQSYRGMRTREILMSVIQTIKCQGLDPELFIQRVLNSKCCDPTADPVAIFTEFCHPPVESSA